MSIEGLEQTNETNQPKSKRLKRLELQSQYLTKLQEIVRYDPNTGEFFMKQNNRKVFPDDEGQYRFWFPVYKKRLNIKLEKAAVYLGSGIVVTDQQRIVFKNLDDRDYRLNNLIVVPRAEYSKIHEAVTNVTQYLKIRAHPTDQFSYFVFYREGKITKRIYCQDIIKANELFKQLKLKFVKLITKYCNTND
jgi:hypothetical protein